MSHLRQQIRDALVVALSGLTLTADRVYTGRTRALARGHEPTILIYTPTETANREFNGMPPELKRPLTIYVEARVVTATPPDDLLDAIAADIEAAMWVNRTLGGLVFNMRYTGADQQVEAQGESHAGGIRLEYQADYRTLEGAPQAVAP